jgi:uncharacterized protein with FMN-binding domain
MLRKRNKILLILSILIVIVGVAAKIILGSMESGLEALEKAEITPVNLAAVEDGTYTGSYSVLPISVEVNVTVADHIITAIDITKHFNGQGEPAEAITDTVLEAQSLRVDAVSGATYSSKVILMAIGDALAQ